jgi:stage II sporulation protein D
VETYLKGMGEVLDPSWPPAALRAQAIAARTYALRAMSIGGQICDDQRCQVYLGAQVEYAAMNAAVDASAHQVLAYGGQLVSALYSANAGGFSADPVEAFGPTGTYPYLRPAPYPTSDPLPWSTTIALRDVGARLGYRGQISDVRVTRTGPSGRAEEVTLDGSRGSLAVAGYTFAAQLGLRSTLFGATLGSAANAPAPPPARSLLQALPGATVGAGGGGSAAGLGLGGRRIGDQGRTRRSLAVIVALVGVLATSTAIGRVFGDGDENAALTRKGRPLRSALSPTLKRLTKREA